MASRPYFVIYPSALASPWLNIYSPSKVAVNARRHSARGFLIFAYSLSLEGLVWLLEDYQPASIKGER